MIYQAILSSANEAWAAGQTPNGVRMNETTQKQLQEEHPLLCRRLGVTSFGVKVTALETPHGTLRLLYDKHLPDGLFIVTVAIPRYTTFPLREEEGDAEST